MFSKQLKILIVYSILITISQKAQHPSHKPTNDAFAMVLSNYWIEQTQI